MTMKLGVSIAFLRSTIAKSKARKKGSWFRRKKLERGQELLKATTRQLASAGVPCSPSPYTIHSVEPDH